MIEVNDQEQTQRPLNPLKIIVPVVVMIAAFALSDADLREKIFGSYPGSEIEGSYSCKDCMVQELTFRKDKIVVTAIGFQYTYDYNVSDGFIYVKTDQGYMNLKIKDENTLEGEGFFKGVYYK